MGTPRGPACCRNQIAFEAEIRRSAAFEIPLFTEAKIQGEMRKGIEPYELLNSFAGFQPDDELHPAIVLRFPFHLDENEALDSLWEGKTADQLTFPIPDRSDLCIFIIL